MQTENELLLYLKNEPAVSFRKRVPLSMMTSFRIGGDADYVLTPKDAGAMIRLLDFLCIKKISFRTVGNGTNLIASDEGFRGVIVHTASIDRISVFGTSLRVGCGASLSRAVNAAREAGLSGMEVLYGIPGTVGGALYMNAGAYGSTVSDHLCSVTVYHPATREISVRTPSELAFSYRSSRLMREGWIVVSASFTLLHTDPVAISERMHDVLVRRSETQPLAYPSAGSIFRKPAENVNPGALIEAAGLKGKRIGGAAVSEKHAGFIVNLGDASAADVGRLIRLVTDKVRETSGYELVPEVEFL